MSRPFFFRTGLLKASPRPFWASLSFVAIVLSFLGATLFLPFLVRSAISADPGDIHFLRIGTGATSGTYFPVGGVLASAISNPPGSRPCDKGGSCGVAGLIAVAQSTDGSVENINGILSGALDSGLSQADLAYWAYAGKKDFKGRAKLAKEKLRVIAHLFPESVHLVVAKDSAITSVIVRTSATG